MAYLQGLPPVPECFSDLIGTDNLQYQREPERIHMVFAHVEENLSLMNGNDNSEDAKSGDGMGYGSWAGEETAADTVPQLNSGLTPFVRLNNTLTRLRKEMVGLRKLDMSLLCQLMSLHEAIQEFKAVMQDRQSETNSEYSFGMSSTMGSMTSIDSCDLADDLQQAELDAQHSLTGSASSLLHQINALKERAESEL